MKIVVLAGGSDQIALIQELKKRGHYIILVDFYVNPPAKNIADNHIVASTLDVDKVKDIVIKENADLVCTACTDQALLTVANVSDQLGLPCYLSYQTALNVTNKLYMKKVMVANKIPTAQYRILDKVDVDTIKDLNLPLVIKPVDCNSSKGVKRIDSIDEVPKFLSEAIKYSRTKTAIVEEFKEGEEISADFYIENGKAKILSATSSIKIKNRKSFTILCSNYPSINVKQQKKIVQIATDISKAFKLNNCPLLVQLIVKGDDINVVEFSARMGGGSKYKLIETLSGVNIMSAYVDLILGNRPIISPLRRVNYCRMIYIYCNPGIFKSVVGLEKMKQQKIVDDYFIYKTTGMEISSAETSGDRSAGYLITAETQEELINKYNYIDSHISVMSQSNEDIMLHNLL